MIFTGYILDETGDNPLSNANLVYVDAMGAGIRDSDENSYTAVTDSTGKYSIDVPDSSFLRVVAQGYVSQTIRTGSNAIMQKTMSNTYTPPPTPVVTPTPTPVVTPPPPTPTPAPTKASGLDYVKAITASLSKFNNRAAAGQTPVTNTTVTQNNPNPQPPPKSPITKSTKIILGVVGVAVLAIITGLVLSFRNKK